MRKFLAETRTDRNVSFSKIYISRDDCEVCTILGERGGEEASLIYHRAVSVDVKTPSRQTTFFPALYFRHVTRDICSERLEYWSTVPFLFSAISSRKFGKLKKKEIIYKDRGINSNASKIHWKKKKRYSTFPQTGRRFRNPIVTPVVDKTTASSRSPRWETSSCFSRTSSAKEAVRASRVEHSFYILLRYPRYFVEWTKFLSTIYRENKRSQRRLWERSVLDSNERFSQIYLSLLSKVKIESRNGCPLWTNMGGRCSLAINSSSRVNLTISSGVRVNDPYNRFVSISVLCPDQIHVP